MKLLHLLASGINNSEIPNIPKVPITDGTISNGLTAVFAVAGVVAVIFIIIGAINYVLSQGESSRTKKAKETIVYAIVGLVITTLAFTIVQVVLWVFQ